MGEIQVTTVWNTMSNITSPHLKHYPHIVQNAPKMPSQCLWRIEDWNYCIARKKGFGATHMKVVLYHLIMDYVAPNMVVAKTNGRKMYHGNVSLS